MFRKTFSILLMIIFISSLFTPTVKVGAATTSGKQSKLSNVSGKFKANVKTLPSDMEYQIEPLPDNPSLKDKDNSSTQKKPGVKNNIQKSTELNDESQQDRNLQGAAKMIINKKISSFKPVKGEIYLNINKRECFKIADDPTLTPDGKQQMTIVSPKYNEVFEYFKIPKQNLNLQNSDLSYTAPEVEMSNSVPAATDDNGGGGGGGSDLPPVRPSYSNGQITFTVKEDWTVYKYPNPDPVNTTTDSLSETAEEKAARVKLEEQKKKEAEDAALFDTKGNSSSLFMDVVLKKDTKITLTDPTLEVFLDIGLLTTDVGIKLKSPAEMEGTLEGNLKYKKEIQILIAGYEINIPSPISDDSIGRAYAGVFLVLQVDGKLKIKVDFLEKGIAEYGVAAKFTNLGNLLGFFPVGSYQHEYFKGTCTVNGELMTQVSIVPQAGIELLSYKLVVLQCWAGIRGTAKLNGKYEVKDEAHKQTVSAETSINLKIESVIDVKAYFAAQKVTIYERYDTLYDNTWTFKEGSAGIKAGNASSDPPVQEYPMKVSIFTACAARDKVYGTIMVAASDENGTDTPYTLGGAKLYVNSNPSPIPINTDTNGQFIIPLGLTWNDTVYIDLNNEFVNKEGVKQSYKILSPKVSSFIPYSGIAIEADAFNDIITGYVTGDYIGFDGKVNTGDEAIFNGNVDIYIKKSDGSSIRYPVKATQGNFEKSIPLVGGDIVYARINFEGKPIESEHVEANLKALDFNAYINPKDPQNNENIVSGYIQNTKGSIPYKNNVYFLHLSKEIEIVKAKPIQNTSVYGLTVPKLKTGNPLGSANNNAINNSTDKKSTNASTYTFKPVTGTIGNGMYFVVINHDGITKKITFGERPEEPTFNITQTPVNDVVDPVVNPADDYTSILGDDDFLTFTEKFDYVMNANKGIAVKMTAGSSKMLINDNSKSLDTSGKTLSEIKNGTVFIPVIPLVDAFGGSSIWSVKTKELKVTIGENQILLKSGNSKAQINGIERSVKVLPYVSSSGNIMLPLEGFAEILGCEVDWNAKDKTIRILHPGVETSNWSGTWQTEYGNLELAQDGTTVTGTRDDGFIISGVVQGYKFFGTYNFGEKEGKLEFVMNPTDDVFIGSYGIGDTPKANWNSWNGKRDSSIDGIIIEEEEEEE